MSCRLKRDQDELSIVRALSHLASQRSDSTRRHRSYHMLNIIYQTNLTNTAIDVTLMASDRTKRSAPKMASGGRGNPK
jgi:hypothetical protein